MEKPCWPFSGALSLFWQSRGHIREGCDVLEQALALAPTGPIASRFVGVAWACWIAAHERRLFKRVYSLPGELNLARAAHVPRAHFLAAQRCCLLATILGHVSDAVALEDEALTVLDQVMEETWAPRAASTMTRTPWPYRVCQR